MRDATRKIVSTALSADSSVPLSAIRDALAVLDGRGPAQPLAGMVRIKDAAALLHVQPRTVRNWISSGMLAAVRGPAPRRIVRGVTESSLRALLDGTPRDEGDAGDEGGRTAAKRKGGRK